MKERKKERKKKEAPPTFSPSPSICWSTCLLPFSTVASFYVVSPSACTRRVIVSRKKKKDGTRSHCHGEERGDPLSPQCAGLGGMHLENLEVRRRNLLNSLQGEETVIRAYLFFSLWFPSNWHPLWNESQDSTPWGQWDEVVLCLILLFTTWGWGWASILSPETTLAGRENELADKQTPGRQAGNRETSRHAYKQAKNQEKIILSEVKCFVGLGRRSSFSKKKKKWRTDCSFFLLFDSSQKRKQPVRPQFYKGSSVRAVVTWEGVTSRTSKAIKTMGWGRRFLGIVSLSFGLHDLALVRHGTLDNENNKTEVRKKGKKEKGNKSWEKKKIEKMIFFVVFTFWNSTINHRKIF